MLLGAFVALIVGNGPVDEVGGAIGKSSRDTASVLASVASLAACAVGAVGMLEAESGIAASWTEEDFASWRRVGVSIGAILADSCAAQETCS